MQKHWGARLTSRCLTRPCHGRSRQGLGICQSSRLRNCFVNLPGKIPWGSADVHARVPLHAQAPRMFHFRVLECGGIWTSPHTGLMVPVHVTEFWEPRHAEYCSLRIGWLILDMQVSWNRGTPKSSMFLWYFPISPISIVYRWYIYSFHGLITSYNQIIWVNYNDLTVLPNPGIMFFFLIGKSSPNCLALIQDSEIS